MMPTHRPLLVAALASLLALGGCAVWTGSAFQGDRVTEGRIIEAPSDEAADPIDKAAGHPAVVEYQPVTVEPEGLAPPPADYRVGPGDVLFVDVYGFQDMRSPAAEQQIVGSRVDGEGRIQLPLLNTVEVGGMTLRQVQRAIAERFGEFIGEPSVVVEVVEHGSQPIYLVGQFNQPGVVFLDRPTNVAHAMAMGRGVNERAHLRGARVLRGDRTLAVDIYRLLREGDMRQNVWLQGGDTLYVPDDREQHVFVLGSVEEPGPVRMQHGRLTLAQAFAGAGGVREVGAALEHVRIIRSLSPTRGELIVVDYDRIVRGEALPFGLMAGDIIYVPRSPLGDWNDMVNEVLPTLRLISGILQPFVQIRVITGEDD